MKAPESFAQAVNPKLTKTIPSKPIPKEESFEFIVSQTKRFYESILTDTNSIEIEHSRDTNNYINYSRVTIKKILDPFEWFANHLHTPIALTMNYKPQIYNWYDYKAAWMNFIYLRPRHTWLIKYSWIPKQPKVQEKARSSTNSSSEATLKQKLKEALDNLEKYDEH
ncbi:hypothetical protein H5410_002792 [Solanum commersonii]|uniref:Uncharacterized protein n=1 Tax=Solanum commersonii TaxID=4109 RepID=A0A9J6B387_SOLCO|nr:hypothetical protein H5410_002792 [Solanum commersonii]